MHRRLFTVALPVAGTLAVATAVATWAAQLRGRILDVELSLGDAGSTSGSTTVVVKKNGTAIVGTLALTIAQAAAVKSVRTLPVGPVGEPSGVDFAPDDAITVDVTAVPGTASKNAVITLLCVAKDI